MEAKSADSMKDLNKVSKEQVVVIRKHQKTLQSMMQKIKDINQKFRELQKYQNALRKNILSMKRVKSVIKEQKKLKMKTAGIGKKVKEMKNTADKTRKGLNKLRKWDQKLWKRVQNINQFVKGIALVNVANCPTSTLQEFLSGEVTHYITTSL